MDKFMNSEEVGRELFKDWVIKAYPNHKISYEFSKVRSCCNDVKLSVIDNKLKQQDFLIEIKVRTKLYPTLLLEAKKYYPLMLESGKDDCEVLYLNFIEGVAYCFNLNNYDLGEWQDKSLIRTTCANNGYEDKSITYLDIKKATIIELK